MTITIEKFGKIEEQQIDEYTLTNSNQLSLSVINYGGIITKIKMSDRKGKVEEITVNVNSLAEIAQSRPFHGAIVGPVAGRIADGKYTENGQEIQLEQNEFNNLLHSGSKGLDNKIWSVEAKEGVEKDSLILKTILPHQEAGFPGNVEVTVTYTLNEENEITIAYEATTDHKTLFNPTNHVYFNLSGNNKERVDEQLLTVASDYYAVLDEENIPTGELRKVDQSIFDLREGRPLKEVFESKEEQITFREGFDHPFLLNISKQVPAAQIKHQASGRKIEMWTDAPAVVVYTHNHEQLPETKNEQTIPAHSGLTLETQALPDAVNQKDFGSIWLKPEEKFTSQTTFKCIIE